jgi:hypothetical protein
VVVDDILGVVKEVPVPSDTPPVEAAYQLIVPAEAVAPNTTVPVPHREPGVVPVIVGLVFIKIDNVSDTGPIPQLAFEPFTLNLAKPLKDTSQSITILELVPIMVPEPAGCRSQI